MRGWTGLVVVIAVLALAGCGGTVPETPTEYDGTIQPAANDSDLTVGTDRLNVTVVRVVDGDTLDIRYKNGTRDTVRLLGIDTPEVEADNQPGEYEGVPDTDAGRACLYEAGIDASEYVNERIDKGPVTIAVDPQADRRGGYGRLLAYVYIGEDNLNYELVATGRARVYESSFTLRERFDATEQRAKDGNRGLWACRE